MCYKIGIALKGGAIKQLSTMYLSEGTANDIAFKRLTGNGQKRDNANSSVNFLLSFI